jgi:serine/threonine protein kinase
VTERGRCGYWTSGEEEKRSLLAKLFGQAPTPQYATPEQLRGERLGAASDLSALGVVLH